MAAGGRVALVLSGGGARGAYEAGVLAHLFEHVYPRLRPGFEFQIVSGTSVGAIHAAYVAASAHRDGPERALELARTWTEMRIRDVLQLSVADLVGIPLRALGVQRLRRRVRGGSRANVLGGLVDISPLERLVDERIPWSHLEENLSGRAPLTLCISCTEVRSGRVTVFMEGQLADPSPWAYDPNGRAVVTRIESPHVRASAAIPFLFPAVRLADRYYVDGGLRMNTPLSPALRLRADRVLVVALKHPGEGEAKPEHPEEVITQPAFVLGKVLNAMLLDQIEYELRQLDLVNAIIDQGRRVYGPAFLERINPAPEQRRGVGYRRVERVVIRPSEDVGRIAASCYARAETRASLGALGRLLTRAALRGGPSDEADLLSYLLFDRCFTAELVELGRADARRCEDEIAGLLGG